MKTCTRCKTTQLATNFCSDRSRPDGLYLHCSDCRRAKYLGNRERYAVTRRQYRLENPERIREAHKKYALKRFFYHRAINLRLRSKSGCASYIELGRLWKQQRGLCLITGRRLNRNNSQLDHIVPVIKGGSSTIENLRWVHRDVNYAKRDLSDAEFFALCREVIAKTAT